MNSAYKWYSHNKDIIEFNSCVSNSQNVFDTADFIQDNAGYAYDTSINIINSYKTLNLN